MRGDDGKGNGKGNGKSNRSKKPARSKAIPDLQSKLAAAIPTIETLTTEFAASCRAMAARAAPHGFVGLASLQVVLVNAWIDLMENCAHEPRVELERTLAVRAKHAAEAAGEKLS
ncbi:MAG: hypothetical protein A2V88_00785 [Elusimicrobia bacterium RBG_16_66_12]|nr:MAG: hypothetical protein A2V88_00785 [Elusimicrobia bacterium RBG_16_66_12]